MEGVGVLVIFSGLAIFFSLGMPTYGFKNMRERLDGYKRSVSKGVKPTLEEGDAYSSYISRTIGVLVAAIGILIITIDNLGWITYAQ